MRRPRITLRVGVAACVAVAVLAGSVTTSVIAYSTYGDTQRRLLVDQVQDGQSAAMDFALAAQDADPTHSVAAVARALDGVDLTYSTAVFDVRTPAGTPCGDSGLCFERLPDVVRHAVLTSTRFIGFVHLRGYASESLIAVEPSTFHNISASSAAHPFALVLFGGTRERLDDLARLRGHLVVLNVAALLLALALASIVAVVIGRPIRRTTTAAQRLGDGDLDVRVPVRGRSELADLAAGFNAMADRLSATLRDLRESQSLQQRFVADVSHELRSPLSVMVAVGDGLDSSDPTARGRAVDLVRTQTRRMADMVEDLLEMSRFDAGQAALDLEPTDLAALVRDASHTVAPDAGIQVTSLGDVTADVDARRVHSVARNLIGNALQHGAPPIEVVVDGRGDPLVLTVTDDGPGIPPDVTDSIFDRFVRADPSRTDDRNAASSRSTGLGLAIARENVGLHGGTVTVSAATPTTFTVELPRRAPGAASAAPTTVEGSRS